jgi:hypothetical protein
MHRIITKLDNVNLGLCEILVLQLRLLLLYDGSFFGAHFAWALGEDRCHYVPDGPTTLLFKK